MFDIDRVLRADGLFWLDNYHCVDDGSKNFAVPSPISSVTVPISGGGGGMTGKGGGD